MHNLCSTPPERPDLYHFTPFLIIRAQVSVGPYSAFEINSQRHVWIHLSGCLILSLGSWGGEGGCLKAWRRREINYSTSTTNNIQFQSVAHSFGENRKYQASFQVQHFKPRRFLHLEGDCFFPLRTKISFKHNSLRTAIWLISGGYRG